MAKFNEDHKTIVTQGIVATANTEQGASPRRRPRLTDATDNITK
jgi:hypothetical protein